MNEGHGVCQPVKMLFTFTGNIKGVVQEVHVIATNEVEALNSIKSFSKDNTFLTVTPLGAGW